MRLFRPFSLLCSCVLASVPAGAGQVLHAADFGVVADGQTDDGPAIQQMLEAAAAVEGPVQLQFPEGRTIYVATGTDRYVFHWDGASDVTLDGGGSTFLLDPYVRFMRMRQSSSMSVQRLRVDFSPLPFADGTVVSVNGTEHYYDVALAPWVTGAPSGGPTQEDGEQAFFAMLWYPGPHGPVSVHCWVDNMAPGPEGTVRVYPSDNFTHFGEMVANEWQVSLPVPGIAHRYGPGECFQLKDNTTVTLADVELWSAPWFGVGVSRNAGELRFDQVHIRPKPGSGRLMSLWRDGFHVKGNSARLRWEGCVLEGMNDDAFNISTHSSVVSAIHSPTRIELRQKFPLLPIPWHAGSTITVVDEEAKKLVGRATITAVEVGPAPPDIQGSPAAPITTATLAAPMDGLVLGQTAWDAAQCNPDTVLRDCTIRMSCRMQSPVQLEGCDISALIWYYGEGIEGGLPHHVRLESNIFRRGRGNPVTALSFAGLASGDAAIPDPGGVPRAIHDVLIKNNEIWGGFTLDGVEHVRLEGNQFREASMPRTLRSNYRLEDSGNTDENGGPVDFGGTPGGTDFDGDGLPDGWETEHRLNAVRETGEYGAEGDPDGDGLSNAEEFSSDTDPRDPESPGGAHHADLNADGQIGVTELLEMVRLYRAGAIHCTDGGYAPGGGDTACVPHDADHLPADWRIGVRELMRIVQIHNAGAYHRCGEAGTEDGFCLGAG